jgi:carbon monoxide dehydrogenase subunit G
MHFEGTVPIKADRQKVWDFLMDAKAVGGCGPGVDSVEVIDDRRSRIVARVGIGIIRATFAIDIERTEEKEPDYAVLRGTGKAPGSAVDGTAEMGLEDGPDGTTVMDWKTDVHIHGKLASVGARMIEGTARKMIDQTFDCIRVKLEA